MIYALQNFRLDLIIMDGALTFNHVCLYSNRRVLEHHRPFIPLVAGKKRYHSYILDVHYGDSTATLPHALSMHAADTHSFIHPHIPGTIN